MGRISESIGREEMVESLACTQDPRAGRLLEMLFDPAYRQHTFSALCERVHLSATDVVDLFRRFKLDQGIIAMARRAPKIMEDTAQDAESTTSLCMTCQGTGEVLEPTTDPEEKPQVVICPNCMGERTFRVPGHDKSRELFFKTMGLMKKEPLIAQQINIHSNQAPTVEDFVMETEKAMKDTTKGRR